MLTDAAREETLRECPFCGGEAVFDEVDDDTYAVFCRDCDASSRWYRDDGRPAIADWNRRAEEAKTLRSIANMLTNSPNDLTAQAIISITEGAATIERLERERDEARDNGSFYMLRFEKVCAERDALREEVESLRALYTDTAGLHLADEQSVRNLQTEVQRLESRLDAASAALEELVCAVRERGEFPGRLVAALAAAEEVTSNDRKKK